MIDNSSAWRMDPDVLLIVPEVNADATKGFTKKNIIANPNCSTAQLVVVLKPCTTRPPSSASWSRPINRSRAGKDAMDELFSQTKAVYTNDELINKKFPSVSPSTSSPRSTCLGGGRLHQEEWKMMAETKKIFDPKIKLTATCVRVPVFSRPFGSRQHRIRESDFGRRGAQHLAQRARLSRDRQVGARRLRHCRTRRPAKTRPISAASARTRRWRTASCCGASPITSAAR